MTVKPPEVIKISADCDGVSCDGGGGSLGHPVVWYSFAKSDVVECKYCDRQFVRQKRKR
ncbi:MAG: zinc-finger domain-containing protein [Alphaproteobacteria bacterium]|jgi:uncharacterized Zn-finger protein|nr:zinc-finger domain-containing protein [Alphaproteobacteria bacterium]MDP7222213.1 zinc-finger domain-containing protein [Alphaproteobacteria bacterium]